MLKWLLPTAVALALAAPALARPITESDLLQFHWVADPQISPDGKTVAYVQVIASEKDDDYENAIWVVPTAGGEPRPLIAGQHDSYPRWSPDGRALAFVRTVKGSSQIFMVGADGGAPHQLTNLSRGASGPVWSPDGRTLAFSSSTVAGEATHRSDVRVITRAVFRTNGAGWIDSAHRSHLWTVEAREGAAPRQMTAGPFEESQPFWSRDSRQLYFTSDRRAQPFFFQEDSNLYVLPVTGGAASTVLDINGPVSHVSIAPNGADFAFIGGDTPAHDQSYWESGLCVSRAGKVTNLTRRSDLEIGSDVLGDQSPPRASSSSLPVWTNDALSVVVCASSHGSANLVRVDATSGAITPLTTGEHQVEAYTGTADASRFALVIGDSTHIGDVYSLDARSGKLVQLTHVNDALFRQLQLTAPERFTFQSFDRTSIDAWVQRPPDYRPGRRYPVIVQIHGGPHAEYGNTFTHEFQWMAAKGYEVLYMNPRGSTGSGEKFANSIQYAYPGDDARDVLAGVDALLARGEADPERLGVTGGSGGGLLTNWIVTRTPRFKAAVSQRSIGDWAGFWYTADFTLFRPEWFRHFPFEDPEEYRARSPVTYVSNITTPMMFLDGDNDLRCPPGQGGETMFRALQALHKTAVMVRFPGENHNLSRNGKPTHRVERLQHIVAWFDRYLLGREIHTYDP